MKNPFQGKGNTRGTENSKTGMISILKGKTVPTCVSWVQNFGGEKEAYRKELNSTPATCPCPAELKYHWSVCHASFTRKERASGKGKIWFRR